MQQEKLKEIKARLNFEKCSGKNSKVQEVPQHSESRTLDARDLRRRLRSRRSHSISGSPKRNPSVFSRVRRDRSIRIPQERSRKEEDVRIFYTQEVIERVCPTLGKPLPQPLKNNNLISRRMDPASQKMAYHKRGTSSRIRKTLTDKAKIAKVDTGNQVAEGKCQH
ncbi:hypothetical protein Tco_0521838 [Tanacetum coccineum]